MIDIIIPTYKPAEFLMECLQSIEDQNVDYSSFKVTIVLNGDKEPYFTNINSILSKFNFSSNFIYTADKGVSNARNLGIDNTFNPYIIFLDDDDLLSKNYLDNMLSLVNENDIVVSNVLSFKDDIKEFSKDYLSFEDTFESDNLVKYRKYLSNSCCKLIPREMIGNRRFNKELFKGEDALFMFELSNRISKIVSTKADVVYFRRLRPHSASRLKYSLLKELAIALHQQRLYTSIYIKNYMNYSFLLYTTRILAVFKVILMKMKG